jgi:hypothetical protein
VLTRAPARCAHTDGGAGGAGGRGGGVLRRLFGGGGGGGGSSGRSLLSPLAWAALRALTAALGAACAGASRPRAHRVSGSPFLMRTLLTLRFAPAAEAALLGDEPEERAAALAVGAALLLCAAAGGRWPTAASASAIAAVAALAWRLFPRPAVRLFFPTGAHRQP